LLSEEANNGLFYFFHGNEGGKMTREFRALGAIPSSAWLYEFRP
jgi:hypothetical protein